MFVVDFVFFGPGPEPKREKYSRTIPRPIVSLIDLNTSLFAHIFHEILIKIQGTL